MSTARWARIRPPLGRDIVVPCLLSGSTCWKIADQAEGIAEIRGEPYVAISHRSPVLPSPAGTVTWYCYRGDLGRRTHAATTPAQTVGRRFQGDSGLMLPPVHGSAGSWRARLRSVYGSACCESCCRSRRFGAGSPVPRRDRCPIRTRHFLTRRRYSSVKASAPRWGVMNEKALSLDTQPRSDKQISSRMWVLDIRAGEGLLAREEIVNRGRWCCQWTGAPIHIPTQIGSSFSKAGE